jgi:hypothetical protein
MPTEIMPYLQHLSYFGIFLMLALLDVLIPLPEEITYHGRLHSLFRHS